MLSRYSRRNRLVTWPMQLNQRFFLSTKLKAATTDSEQGPLTEFKGRSGRLYKIEKILQDKGVPRGRVFLANADRKYILKEIPRNNFAIRSEVYQKLGSSPHVRDLEDTIPDHSMFVFEYFSENLLGWIQQDPPVVTIRQVLKQSLQGIAAMHAQDIVHNDIKPDNILLEVSERHPDPVVQRVVITDLEDSAHCPPPGNLIGAQLGNWMWRSPEAHAEGPMNKPSDIFAFALVCIYAMTKGIMLGVVKEELAEGEDILAIVLERQLSYFCDPNAFADFIEHLHSARPDNPWIEVFHLLRSGFNAENPREPFTLWKLGPHCDEQFRDLIVKMTNFNPRQRMTATEALSHPWFKGV